MRIVIWAFLSLLLSGQAATPHYSNGICEVKINEQNIQFQCADKDTPTSCEIEPNRCEATKVRCGSSATENHEHAIDINIGYQAPSLDIKPQHIKENDEKSRDGLGDLLDILGRLLILLPVGVTLWVGRQQAKAYLSVTSGRTTVKKVESQDNALRVEISVKNSGMSPARSIIIQADIEFIVGSDETKIKIEPQYIKTTKFHNPPSSETSIL